MTHKNKISTLLLLAFAFTSFTTFKNANKEWVLKKEAEGVSVYNRDAENSSLKELKAVTQLNASLSSIIALLSDKASFPKWIYKCEKSYVIKPLSEAEAICYQNVVAPWPLDNRDIVINVKVYQDAVTKVVYQKATGVPNYIKEVDGHVRITLFNALWTLTPLNNGLVKCEYQLLLDPGGNLPAWLVNLAAIDGPFETTVNMKKMLLSDKYKTAKYSFITEP